MPYIESFIIDGLAGRKSPVTITLNRDVNIFFGLNGSGKTSLLRILHSALLHKADLLKDVAFKSSEVIIHSWSGQEFKYQIEKPPIELVKTTSTGSKFLRTRTTFEWLIEPTPESYWPHAYLPIARLYEGSAGEEIGLFQSRDNSELGLEARFASNVLSTWKDYTRLLSYQVNSIQETGLARILERVLSRSEPSPKDSLTDSTTAYEAVSTFLARRGVHDITPSSDEFRKRYNREPQFRGLVQDIEDVEKKITNANAPMRALDQLLREMFIPGKDLSLNDDSIEFTVAGKRLSLSALSSGEKQLVKILVETVNAGASVILIDEPELSMHVDWQRRLISAMRTLNPSAQLIIATHSPEVMADIPDNRIFQI